MFDFLLRKNWNFESKFYRMIIAIVFLLHQFFSRLNNSKISIKIFNLTEKPFLKILKTRISFAAENFWICFWISREFKIPKIQNSLEFRGN